MKKLPLILSALFLLSLVSLAGHFYFQNPPTQTPCEGRYRNCDPCSDNVLYKAAVDFEKGILIKAEYDKIIAEHETYKKENCGGNKKKDEQAIDKCKDINLTHGGKIGTDQKICGPGADINILKSKSLPIGGDRNLPIIYAWQQKVGNNWQTISGTNKVDYQPEMVRETTKFRRTARRKGCLQTVLSNEVTIKVGSKAVAEISGPSSIEAGKNVRFSSPKSSLFDGHEYSWRFVGGQPTTSTERKPTVTWNQGGIKSVYLEVERKGCISRDEFAILVIGKGNRKEEKRDSVSEDSSNKDVTKIENRDSTKTINPKRKKSTPSKVKPKEVEKYVGYPQDFIWPGGPYKTCPSRSLFYKINGSEVSIWVNESKQIGNACVSVKNDKQIMKHPFAQEDRTPIEGDTSLMFRMIPALTPDGRNNTYIGFNHQNNRYFEWQRKEFNCTEAEIPLPIPGFNCPSHGHSPTPEACGNLRREIEKRKKKAKADCKKFVVLFPSRQTDTVYVLRKNTKSVMKGLSASMFRFPNQNISFPDGLDEQQQASLLGNLLHQLAIFVGYDEGLEIMESPSEKGLFFTVTGKTKNNGRYLISFGYDAQGNYREYIPVNLFAGIELSQLVTQKVYLSTRIANYIDRWQKTGIPTIIKAVLPPNNSDNPLVAVGQPNFDDKFPPNILESRALDFLIDEAGYKIQRFNGSIEDTWYGKQLENHQNNWLPYLAIADPKLKPISDSPSQSTFVFRFKNRNQALWSWKTQGTSPPMQRKLLDGKLNYQLKNEKVATYINHLKKPTAREKEFWLSQALLSNPRQVVPLDNFSNNNSFGNVFLFSWDKKGQKAFRLSKDFSGKNPIRFLAVATNWKNWRELKTYYQRWKSPFYQEVVTSHLSNLEVWYGQSRMGISMSSKQRKLVSVHLQQRSFKRATVSKIQRMIEKDSFIYRPSGVPSKNQLLHSWLSSNWNKKTWRANPLGYLERAL